jgi:hypothetical protein
MFTETAMLAFGGGVAGVLLAVTAVPFVARLVPTNLPIAETPTLDWRMLVAAAIATSVTAVGVGVFPAIRLGRQTDPAALREGTRIGSGRRAERLRSALVVAEVSACVVLLVCSTLLVRALWNVQQTDPGFKSDSVLTLRTALPMPKYASTTRRQQFYDQVLREIRALPGVANAAYISFLPMVMRGGVWAVSVDGKSTDPALGGPLRNIALLRFVTPGFFETTSIPVMLGRDIAESDTLSARWVAIVSESFVKQHWPGVDPIGRQLTIGGRPRTVVGVVGDIRVRGLERSSEPQV